MLQPATSLNGTRETNRMFATREGMGRHAQESSGNDTMRFADGVSWRISQRGLVVCGPGNIPC